MSNKTPNQQIVANDILKYKTNKIASSLALLSIVFSCLYFCLLYSFRSTAFDGFKNWELGFSVILTLFSLLITFLASEGIKGYNKKFAIVLLVLAVVQIIRIFGLPLQALNYDKSHGNLSLADDPNVALTVRYFGVDLKPGAAYTIMVIWLVASATCLVLSAVFGYINCVKLESHIKKVDSGEINIDEVLISMDREDERQASNVVSESNLTDNELKLVEEEANA